MDTNTKPDIIGKTLLGIIVVLLAYISFFGIPSINTFVNQRSESCDEAIKVAQETIDQDINFLDDYENDVYGPNVDNINQQIFRVGEYQYLTQERLLLQNKALLLVITACQ